MNYTKTEHVCRFNFDSGDIYLNYSITDNYVSNEKEHSRDTIYHISIKEGNDILFETCSILNFKIACKIIQHQSTKSEIFDLDKFLYIYEYEVINLI